MNAGASTKDDHADVLAYYLDVLEEGSIDIIDIAKGLYPSDENSLEYQIAMNETEGQPSSWLDY